MTGSPAVKAMQSIIRSKCKANTKGGKPCGNFAVKGGDFCAIHPCSAVESELLADEDGDVCMDEQISNFSWTQLLQQISGMIKGEIAPIITKLDLVAELVVKVANLESKSEQLESQLEKQTLRMIALEDKCRVMEEKLKTVQVQQAKESVEPQLAAMRATVDELKARPSYAQAAATVTAGGGAQGGWTPVPLRSGGGNTELLQFTLTGIEVTEGLRGGELGELLVGTIKERIGV